MTLEQANDYTETLIRNALLVSDSQNVQRLAQHCRDLRRSNNDIVKHGRAMAEALAYFQHFGEWPK